MSFLSLAMKEVCLHRSFAGSSSPVQIAQCRYQIYEPLHKVFMFRFCFYGYGQRLRVEIKFIILRTGSREEASICFGKSLVTPQETEDEKNTLYLLASAFKDQEKSVY